MNWPERAAVGTTVAVMKLGAASMMREKAREGRVALSVRMLVPSLNGAADTVVLLCRSCFS
jgi:hypothetical protein